MSKPVHKNWLADVAVLNSNPRFNEPGDVQIFRNISDMCSELEPWFVEEQEGYALNGNGEPIELTTDGDVVFGKVVLGEEPEVSVLKEWLVSAAKSLRDARIYKADKPGIKFFASTQIGEAERQGILPTSIEGLIAYVGFS